EIRPPSQQFILKSRHRKPSQQRKPSIYSKRPRVDTDSEDEGTTEKGMRREHTGRSNKAPASGSGSTQAQEGRGDVNGNERNNPDNRRDDDRAQTGRDCGDADNRQNDDGHVRNPGDDLERRNGTSGDGGGDDGGDDGSSSSDDESDDEHGGGGGGSNWRNNNNNGGSGDEDDHRAESDDRVVAEMWTLKASQTRYDESDIRKNINNLFRDLYQGALDIKSNYEVVNVPSTPRNRIMAF
ncbi:hypothetical protein F5051DRAFT_434689, partial [Lentinula edodes]